MKIIKILSLLLVFFLYGCDDTSTNTDKEIISGVVSLIDLEGNFTIVSGVQVVVFEKDIANIAWDYRLMSPMSYTSTDVDGRFLLEIEKRDNLIVVFLYEGYSVKEYSLNDLLENVILYQDIEISGAINYPIILDGTFDLVVTGDTFFIEGSSLSITESSKIRIETNEKLTIASAISIENDLSISSNSKVYTLFNETVELFNAIEILPQTDVSEDLISRVSCSFSNNGLLIRKGNLTIKESFFTNSNNGLYINDVNDVSIEKIGVRNILNISGGGIYLDNTNNVQILNCDFSFSRNGIKVKEVSELFLTNSYFRNNTCGYLSYFSTGSIENNTFANNSVADIELMGNSTDGTLYIIENIFSSLNALYMHPAGSWHFLNNVIIKNNNFIENDIFIKYSSSSFISDIQAQNNYFNGFTEEVEIQSKIVDTSSVEQLFIDVLVMPFRVVPYGLAGVQE